jgi:Holliday junction resolvase RusA-like endonuclease
METTSPSFEALKAALNDLLFIRREKSGPPPYRAVSFVLPVQPMPAPRPKFTRDGYAYTGKAYVTWRGQVKPHIPALEPIITGLRVGIALDLVLPPYKTVKTPWPKGDIDNYEKAIWDIITKGGLIWKDDIQVCLSITGKRFARLDLDERPHAAVYIREIF